MKYLTSSLVLLAAALTAAGASAEEMTGVASGIAYQDSGWHYVTPIRDDVASAPANWERWDVPAASAMASVDGVFCSAFDFGGGDTNVAWYVWDLDSQEWEICQSQSSVVLGSGVLYECLDTYHPDNWDYVDGDPLCGVWYKDAGVVKGLLYVVADEP